MFPRPARFGLLLLLGGCACASSSTEFAGKITTSMSLRAIPAGCSVPQDTQAQVIWFQCDDGREGYVVARIK